MDSLILFLSLTLSNDLKQSAGNSRAQGAACMLACMAILLTVVVGAAQMTKLSSPTCCALNYHAGTINSLFSALSTGITAFVLPTLVFTWYYRTAERRKEAPVQPPWYAQIYDISTAVVHDLSGLICLLMQCLCEYTLPVTAQQLWFCWGLYAPLIPQRLSLSSSCLRCCMSALG